MPSNDDGEQAALKAGCIKRLREMNTRLQTQLGSLTPTKHTNSQTKMQEEWSQLQLEDGALLLLTHLMELQEVQASALLETLVDRNAQHIQTLRDKYEDEIKAQRFTSLLHLLTSDTPQTLVSMPIPNLTENSNTEPILPQTENISGGLAKAMTADSIKGASIDTNEGQTANGSDRQDVCSGCGAVIEDLPFLEILCEPDKQADVHKSLSADGGANEEEEGSATKNPQSYQKQGSLITLAWSKRLETAEGGADQHQDVESMRTQVQPTQSEETGQNRDGEEVDIALSQCGSSGHQNASSADPQCGPVEQLILNMRPVDDQTNEKEVTSKGDQQTLDTVAENLQAMQQHLMADSSENADELCSETTNHTVNAGKEMTEVEMRPTEAVSELWELRGPELFPHEDLTHWQDSPVDCNLSKSAAKREPTLMERERTMRSLVDMQKKVEQRQQRDRKRQLLRVQERLSIIQNRKAEEDLLGLKHTDRLRHLTQDLPLVTIQRGHVPLYLVCFEKLPSCFRRTRGSRRLLLESDWSSSEESAPTSCSPEETGIQQDLRNSWLQLLCTAL
ncbi:uncharacterized protein LOC142383916 isoform X1 [Odontesthes bonariensis]|uniref:uncharacterized protein LOC142383916 isoform X1 n=1 Tax=Odontesthes bonariensis TaxID=219752 RepID=UPI003F58A25D